MGHNIFEFSHPCDHEELRNNLRVTAGVCVENVTRIDVQFWLYSVFFLRGTYIFKQVYLFNFLNCLFLRGSLERWKEGLCHEDKKRSDTQRKKRQPQVSYVEG